MTLISASELAAIQTVAQSGMQSSASILTRATLETPDGQQSVWATSALDVPCWVKQITGDASILGAVSGAIAIGQLVNIRVPIGTDVSAGDYIIVDTITYTVQAGNQSDTYPAWWEYACRVLE